MFNPKMSMSNRRVPTFSFESRGSEEQLACFVSKEDGDQLPWLMDQVRHPSSFIAGKSVSQLKSPNPRVEEVEECTVFMKTDKWGQMIANLVKWQQRDKSATFMGTESVRKWRAWEAAMLTFYRVWSVTNSVLQARLATYTFSGNAEQWWLAHLAYRPTIEVTFTQLREWIARELVPTALPAASHLEWLKLSYKGDIDSYIEKITELALQHPLEPTVLHAVAAKPFGEEFVAKVAAIDDEKGGSGMSLPQFKRQLRLQATQWAGQQRNNERRNRIEALNVKALDVEQEARRTEFRQKMFCAVCGSLEHWWPQCSKKQEKGCAACGSRAHLVRT